MLATRTTRRTVKCRAGVTLTDNETFEVDTVSPHDKEALKVVAAKEGSQEMIPNLLRGAARSRDLCEVHRCVARESIRAARHAKELGNTRSYRENMQTAVDARRRAGECRQFSRECEERANALIMAGSSAPGDTPSAEEPKTPGAVTDCSPTSIER